MKYLLGIDIGTSGTKTVLFDEKGNAKASYVGEYAMHQPQNGWAEQNPADWWNATVNGIRYVTAKNECRAEDIVSIGLSGQMHSLVMLDARNEVLCSSILWCDQRTGEQCEQITNLVGAERLLKITANPALTGFTASKILWMQKYMPEIYEKCAHILLPKDYIRFMLTGEYATEVSDASGMQLLDVANRCWSDEVISKLGIDKNLLAKVYESPEITGEVTASSANLTGLAQGTLVVGGAGDNAAAAIGTGTVKNGKAFTTIGSSGVVYAHTDHMLTDKRGRVHTFCCAVPGAWHVMGVTQAAGLSLKWFRDNFCTAEIETAKTMGVDPYYLMDFEAEKSVIGANKLLFLPYLMGERTPHLDPNLRGGFFGLSAMHGKRDMIRSIMEGITFSLNDCLSVFGDMDMQVSTMVACGGGGSSRFWRQMLADVFGIEISRAHSKEGPALGAAILAGVGAGLYNSVEEACDEIIIDTSKEKPNLEAHTTYNKYYKLYTALYPALKNEFDALAGL